MAGLIALREPIVNLLFQRGNFDYSATVGTADALLFYSIGIWSIVGVRVVTTSFYAMQDTKTPVQIAVAGMLTNIALSAALMGTMKHSGLALANSVASMVNFFILFYFLRRKLKRIDARRIAKSFVQVMIASVIMGFSGWTPLHGELWEKSGHNSEKAFYFGGTVILCVGIYVAVSYLLKSEEMEYLFKTFREKMQRKGA
jgi:putative peptidoglycan lipid II flippase